MAPVEPASSLSGDTETSANEFRHFIDKKIVDLLEEIPREIRRVKYSPMSQLPPELLGRIFAFATSELTELPTRFDSWSFNFPRSFNFTYVSKKWRSTALQTPDLWGIIPCFGLDAKWAMLMLERSKMVDLVLVASLSEFPLSVIKGILDNHSSHIREIHFDWATKSVMSELLKDVQASSLRRLRSLHVSAACPPLPDTWPSFPKNILGELHGLQYLRLWSINFWPSAFPSNLSSLILFDIHTDYRPSFSAFIGPCQLWNCSSFKIVFR